MSLATCPGPSPDTPQRDNGTRVAGRVLRKTRTTFEVLRSSREAWLRSSSALSSASQHIKLRVHWLATHKVKAQRLVATSNRHKFGLNAVRPQIQSVAVPIINDLDGALLNAYCHTRSDGRFGPRSSDQRTNLSQVKIAGAMDVRVADRVGRLTGQC